MTRMQKSMVLSVDDETSQNILSNLCVTYIPTAHRSERVDAKELDIDGASECGIIVAQGGNRAEWKKSLKEDLQLECCVLDFRRSI